MSVSLFGFGMFMAGAICGALLIPAIRAICDATDRRLAQMEIRRNYKRRRNTLLPPDKATQRHRGAQAVSTADPWVTGI